MEEKKLYTPAEVAEIAEAYHQIYCGPESERMERLKQYEEFAPENARDAISKLRDVEYYFSGKTSKQKEEIMKNLEAWTTGSEQFSEFIKAFLI